MYVCSYSTHRDDVFPLWVHRWDSGSCTDLCTLPPASIGQNQTAIDLPVVAGTCVALPQAMQRGRGKHSGGGHSCWLSPERRAARWLPDRFSGPLPILYHQLSLSVSEVCSGRLIFWTRASPILLRWALVTRLLEIWFMNGSHQEYSFLAAGADNGGAWMKQFVTSSLPLTFTSCWPLALKGALLENYPTETWM